MLIELDIDGRIAGLKINEKKTKIITNGLKENVKLSGKTLN